MSSLDEAKMRAEVSSNIFGDRLRHFVQQWAPSHPHDRDDFQMALTRLMVDAMRHKSDCMSVGIATYAEPIFAEMAMRPLHVIMEKKDSTVTNGEG